MNKLTAAVAALGAAGGALAGALAMPTIVNADLPALAPHMEVDESGLVAQTIVFTPTAPTYGHTLTPLGGESSKPVVVTPHTPATCQSTDTGRVALVGVGTCSLTLTQDGDGTFAPAAPLDKTFDVAPAPLSIRVMDTRKASGDPDPQWQTTVTGLVNGDGEDVISGLRISAPPSDFQPGTYALRPWNATAPDYAITFVNGTLTIDPVIRLDVSGLSAGVPDDTIVAVDSVFVRTPYHRTVDLGSQHSVFFRPVLREQVSADLYVTTTPKLSSSAITDDVTTNAAYARIDDLIEAAAVAGDPDGTHQLAIRTLVTKWHDVQSRLGQAGALADLQGLADDVRATAETGGLLTDAGEQQVLAHLQVVYRWYGGVGSV